MNQKETNNLDFNLDFASGDGGQVATLDSFLEVEEAVGESTPQAIDNPIVKESDVEDVKVDENKFVPLLQEEAKLLNTKLLDTTDTSDLGVEEDTVTNSSLNYKQIVEDLVDSKLWDSIDAFETPEGEVTFSDMDIDKEAFVEIFKQKVSEEIDKAVSDKVSVKGVSDFTKKLIDIEKNGGNVQQALESYQTYKNPLEGMDLTKESDQQATVYLKLQAAGLDDKDIIDVIGAYRDKGELETKANEAKVSLEQAFDKQMESINQQAVENKAKRVDALKKYRTDFGNNLKQFELVDTFKRKIVDLATKENSKGQFEMDNIYNDKRRDPNEAVHLSLFLADREEYLKQMTEFVRREDKLETLRTIKLVPKSKSSSVKIGETVEKENSDVYLDIEKII